MAINGTGTQRAKVGWESLGNKDIIDVNKVF